MRSLINRLLEHRARYLTRRLSPWLKPNTFVLDVGAGTGHNAREIKKRKHVDVINADVVDMRFGNDDLILYDGIDFPFRSDAFDCGLLLFILHYPENPISILRNLHQIVQARLIVMQSTYSTRLDLMVLKIRELFQGRLALRCCRLIGLVRGGGNSLKPSTYLERCELERMFEESGWKVVCTKAENWPFLSLSRDMFVLEKHEEVVSGE